MSEETSSGNRAGLFGEGADGLWSRRLFRGDPFHYSWLLYLLFWFIVPMEVPSLRSWLYLAVALIVFVALYTMVHCWSPLRTRRLAVVGMVLLALVYVPVNESAFGIYIYIGACLPEVTGKARATYILMGAECALILLQAWIWNLHSWEWSIACGISLVTAVNVQHLETERRSRAKLQRAHDEIAQLAKTAERERIARDLHDVLGHTLSLISLKSELAARLLETQPERTAQELAEIQITARRALAEVRQTVSGYRTQGLEAEMQQAVATLAAAGVTVASRPERIPRLPAQQEASLSLLLREAVTNIVRHAQARSCTIALRVTPQDGGAITQGTPRIVALEVADDGVGMRRSEGNGLRGMRERVSELGGVLALDTRDGVRLRVELPLPASEPAPSAEFGGEQERAPGIAGGAGSMAAGATA